MRKGGFIFSLDAFVAFTLIMITISLLIFTIGTPKPYYISLEQTHVLAHDTLQALASSSPTGTSPPTYLEKILSKSDPYNDEEVKGIMREIAGGNSTPPHYPIIPKGYGFSLENLDFSTGLWHSLYNSSADTRSDRSGKNFSKLQSSSTIFVSLYPEGMAPAPGEPMYCYISCHGYQPDGTHLSTCDRTPCSRPTDNFGAGNNSIQLVRLVVFT